jgi:hypothetical protein
MRLYFGKSPIEHIQFKQQYFLKTDLLPLYEYDKPSTWSELVSLIARGDLAGLKTLMEESKKLRISDRYGNTPLHLSVIFKKYKSHLF